MSNRLKKLNRAFTSNNDGNIALYFAIVFAVIIFCVAVAIDFARMTSVKTDLRDLTDNAALAGAYVAEDSEQIRQSTVASSLTQNGYYSDNRYMGAVPTIVFDDENREVSVSIKAPVGLLFAGVLGMSSKDVTSVSTATYLTEEIAPVSISFALDVSGSMGENTPEGDVKIDVLKNATKSLFTAIESSVKNPATLRSTMRTGMTAYNTAVVDTQPMNFGWTALEGSVDALTADGGTNSTPALQGSIDQLLNDSHQPDDLRQFIIFMTDGDNNQVIWDAESEALCVSAKAQGIEIYSVAFAAPEKGQALLFDCASPNTNGNNGNGNGNNGNGNGNGNNGNGNGNNQNGNGEPCNAGNGNGNGYGRCKNLKSEHYFDASDAAAFEAAFKKIGEEIGSIDLRIKS